jgi:hypothetical protein
MTDTLSSLKTSDLVKVFNAATGGSVKKFETRGRGLGRTRVALDQAGMTLDQALIAAGLAAAPSKPESVPQTNGIDDVDAAVLAAAAEPVRMAGLMAAVPGKLGWDGINPLTMKRRIRSAINRLISDSRLTWTDKEAKGARHFIARS